MVGCALELGQQIKAIQRAIERPEIEGSLKAVTQLGHDQRYYVMVRGWLAYQLQADESIAAATPETSPKIRRRIDFLKRAIRAVDLE